MAEFLKSKIRNLQSAIEMAEFLKSKNPQSAIRN